MPREEDFADDTQQHFEAVLYLKLCSGAEDSLPALEQRCRSHAGLTSPVRPWQQAPSLLLVFQTWDITDETWRMVNLLH